MKVYIFAILIAVFTTGCIPKYVDKKVDVVQKTKEPVIVEKKQEIVEEIVQTREEIVIQEPIMQEVSKSYKITMKTKKFSFSDTGFLVKSDDMIRLNVLAMGNPVLDLKVKQSDDVCVGSLCNTKLGFNQSFLSGEYPESLIENVLNKKPIFDGKNLIKTSNGFIQNIESKNYKIKYQISRGSIYFKDSKNKIIMKLKEL
jgi:hypothetical protein